MKINVKVKRDEKKAESQKNIQVKYTAETLF